MGDNPREESTKKEMRDVKQKKHLLRNVGCSRAQRKARMFQNTLVSTTMEDKSKGNLI